MKSLFAVVALSLVSTAAFADVTIETNGGREKLYGCAQSVSNPGDVHAYLEQGTGSVIVKFENVTACSRISGAGDIDRLTGGSGELKIYADKVYEGRNDFRIKLSSESGKHQEMIDVIVYKAYAPAPTQFEFVRVSVQSKRAPMAICGGTVNAFNSNTRSGAVTLRFKGAYACNSVSYLGSTAAFQHGSGDIDVIHPYNGITVKVRSTQGSKVVEEVQVVR